LAFVGSGIINAALSMPDCRELAKNTPDPELELHYLKMADHWSALSVSGPVALSGESDSDADTKDT
jgi:hypothetical protein